MNKTADTISFGGGLEALDRAIGTLQQFAALGLTKIALRGHDDPAAAIRLAGARDVPVFRAH